MRHLTIFLSEGQVQASVDLDAGSRVDLSADPQIAKTAASDTDEGSSSSGIIGWIKSNWKLASIGASVMLLLVVGAWLSM
jgi:hypothetical protein